MGKICVEKFKIISDKNINKRICLISDIHHNCVRKNKFYDEIISSIKITNPDYIVIAGDIIDQGREIDDIKSRDVLECFISNLGTIAPTIVTIGNHDLVYSYRNRDMKGTQLEWFKTLSKYKNVYYIYNDKVSFDRIEFVHFTPSADYFRKSIKSSFYDEFRKNPVNIETNDNYKVLISHSPIAISNKYNYGRLKEISENINLIVSGHMHNGVMPKFLEFLDFKKRGLGLLSPSKKLFPIYCRGIHKLGNMNLVVSRGITKVGLRKLGSIFNIFYPKDITIIDLE